MTGHLVIGLTQGVDQAMAGSLIRPRTDAAVATIVNGGPVAAVEPDRFVARPLGMTWRLPVSTVGVLIVMVSGAACGVSQGGTSAASCAGPQLDDRPPGRYYTHPPTPSVHPGDELVVYGHWYTSTCNDTGRHDPLRPLPPVKLTLTLPGGRVEPVGTFTPAGSDMGFHTSVQIPVDSAAGTATLSDDREPPATYAIEVSE